MAYYDDHGFLVYQTASGDTAALCLECGNFAEMDERETHIHRDASDPNVAAVLEEFHEIELVRELQNRGRDRASCQRCGNAIPIAYPGLTNTDNGLTLILTGGYGEFHDSLMGDVTVSLCHGCAHAMCEFIHVDATNFHTHTDRTHHYGEYGQEHR
jgi:hypothetical protein